MMDGDIWKSKLHDFLKFLRLIINIEATCTSGRNIPICISVAVIKWSKQSPLGWKSFILSHNFKL